MDARILPLKRSRSATLRLTTNSWLVSYLCHEHQFLGLCPGIAKPDFKHLGVQSGAEFLAEN